MFFMHGQQKTEAWKRGDPAGERHVGGLRNRVEIDACTHLRAFEQHQRGAKRARHADVLRRIAQPAFGQLRQ
jgi:hypothetical protein